MGKIKRKSNTFLKALYILLAVLLFFAALVSSMLIANIACEKYAHVLPSYAREQIVQTLLKENKTQEDYDFLYRQTGISREGFRRLENEADTKAELVALANDFQNALFSECEIAHEIVSPVTMRDTVLTEDGKTFRATLVPLETGDVLVTSVCHTFGWRHGHSALVVEGNSETLLESVTVGRNSCMSYNGAVWFCESANFMVLRLKDEYREQVDPKQVAASAVKNLNNIPYSLTVGIFSKKDQGTTPAFTQCSHLVWQAFKNFGIDIDSNGGAIVSTQDIANSPYFEVVQVYGFDPLKLWK